MRRPLFALALLSATATAQTGPWKDGELIVRMNPGGSFENVIYRIDPQTGHGAMLADTTYLGTAGSAVFDNYRNGVLAYCSVPPDSWALQSLWLFAADGTATKLGLSGAYPGALAPTGDGRIFFQRDDVVWWPQIEWLDASNVAHVLMDSTGTAPYQHTVDAMIYSPAQNALFAATREGAPDACSGALCSVLRIPLSADGTRVGGAVTCTTWDGGGTENPTNFDELPGGDLLLTFNSSYVAPDKFQRVNAATGALSTFAKCIPHDVDGGVWSPAVSRIIIINDGTNQLETYTAGDDGTGDALVTDVPVSGFTSGTGPGNLIFEVKLGGPGCAGLLAPYGAGLGGKGGFVPVLAGAGCPDVGNGFAITIDHAVGGASGLLFVGLSQAALAFKGGTFLVGSLALQVPLAVGGAPGQAGAGFLSLPGAILDPALIGIDIYLQAGFQDGAAVKGASLSNGLRLQAG
ncbi:MAG TPA: hypothetical protein VFY71_12495 [Planctomycetota bacterium]|nr:hypothetical protein [Planctomycetota bacterium]